MTRIYNHIPDTEDQRDLVFQASRKKLPASVDLREHMPPIFDQGQLGSCTANGILGLRGYYMLASGLSYVELSRLFLYYKEREIEGAIGDDSGAMIRDGMKVLSKIGCAPEPDFPYDINKFTDKPSAKAEADAANFKIAGYSRVTPNINGFKAALAAKQPVVFGFQVHDSFESQAVADTGIVPMPSPSEANLGGHCVLAVGYDDAKQVVIVRNSWGEGWGDKGYCYMPYAMFQYPLVTDAWTGKLNPVLKASELTFDDAIAYSGELGILVSPEAWITFEAMFEAGTLTNEHFKWVKAAIINYVTFIKNQGL